jgi:hypothetical protein
MWAQARKQDTRTETPKQFTERMNLQTARKFAQEMNQEEHHKFVQRVLGTFLDRSR